MRSSPIRTAALHRRGAITHGLLGALSIALMGALLGASTVAALAPRAWAGTGTLVNSYWAQTNVGAWDPPDPNGACGPRGILTLSNDRFGYLAKDGTRYYYLALRDFFPPPTPPNILNDPRAVYDPQSGRFFVTCSDFAISGGPSSALHAYLDVAVSTSSHPTSATDWVKFQFDVTQVVGSGGSEEHFAPDYPTLGIDAQGLHVGANFFHLPADGSTYFDDIGLLTFAKAELLAGGAVTPLVTYLSAGVPSALQPASVLWDAIGPGAVTYFVETPPGLSSAVRLWALSDPLGARTVSSSLIAVPAHGSAIELLAPQPGTNVRLRTWSNKAQGLAQWRDGAIWFASTGDTTETGGGVRTRVYWYRIAPNGFPAATPALDATGVFDGGQHVWNFLPAIGVTPRGDVGVVFQQSSDSLAPRMMFAGRHAAAAGFAPAQLVAASTGSFTLADLFFGAGKWGDDYTTSVDPADSSLWMTCELVRTPQNGSDVLWLHEWANVIFDADAPGWPAGGKRVRQGQTHVSGVGLVSDDSAGVLVGWYDKRLVNDTPAGVLGQRLLPTGEWAGGWRINGTTIAAQSSPDGFKRIVADGSGGAYYVYSSPLFVTRVGRNGAPPAGWPATPVQVATSSGVQLGAAQDGAGGLLLAYSSSGVKLQRVAPTGALAWSAPSLIAATAAQLDVATDAAAGAYVAWSASGHVRVQHVLAAGVLDPAWPATGSDCGSGSGPRLVADGAGGVFVVYGLAGDILARRLLSNGSPATGWTSPFAVCAATGTQDQHTATADGSGGLLVAWSDARSATSERDLYAQRVTGAAALAPGWPADGVGLSLAPGDQSNPAITTDGAGGAVIAWTDDRSQPGCTGAGCGSDCYWARVTGGGIVESALGVDGAVVCAEPGDQSSPSIAWTANGVAMAAWLDGRSTPDGDPDFSTQVFAQRLAFDVTPPASAADLRVELASCTTLRVSWTAPGDDGIAGTAAAYDLRYSSQPIDAGNFSSATALVTAAPGAAGSTESYTYEFGNCSGPIHFALRTRDDVGNTSGVSNLPGASSTWCAPPECQLGVAPEPGSALVDALGLPRPNPAAGRIGFDVSVSAASAGRALECAVFDVSGRLVRILLSEPVATTGRRTLEWDLRDSSGQRVHVGLFFVRLRLGGRMFSHSLTVR